MPLGGSILKLITTLCLFPITISLLFISNSFTANEIKSNTNVSVVSHENALISISYTNNLLQIINNTEKEIELNSLKLVGGEMSYPLSIQDEIPPISPGETEHYSFSSSTMETDQKILAKFVWDTGEAEIFSPPISISHPEEMSIENATD